jgi:hypothetical protein
MYSCAWSSSVEDADVDDDADDDDDDDCLRFLCDDDDVDWGLGGCGTMNLLRLPTLPVRMPPSESTHNTLVAPAVVADCSGSSCSSKTDGEPGCDGEGDAGSAGAAVGSGGPVAGLACVVLVVLVAAWVASGIVLRPCRQSNTQMLGVSNHRAVDRGHLQ